MTHSSTTIVKFEDNTTVIRLIQNKDKTDHRDELQADCTTNNLILNISKTRAIIISFTEQEEDPAPLNIKGGSVERVPVFKLLGTYITQDLKDS